MKVQDRPPLHLTYCMNVHPGETWEENFAAVRDYALRVRSLVGRPGPFGLGLRLSCRAARTLSEPARLREFSRFCAAHDLYVFTLNGFPYGPFHGVPVKADVYRPDWRSSERLHYTNMLTDILAALLPPGVSGSISTVPGSYKPWIRDAAAAADAITDNLCAAAAYAAETRARTGKTIAIALEPEPDGFLENAGDCIEFFSGQLAGRGRERLRQRGYDARAAAAVLARHIGVCFDTAHSAVAFEDTADSLAALRDAGIATPKVHLGAALSVPSGAGATAALRKFCEDIYLHQTRRKSVDGAIRSFADLPDALAAPAAAGDQWRVHFHVPLDFEGRDVLGSTRSLLTPRFAALLGRGVTEHLEIETYTYSVLPPDLAPSDIAAGVAREYRWVLSRIIHKNG